MFRIIDQLAKKRKLRQIGKILGQFESNEQLDYFRNCAEIIGRDRSKLKAVEDLIEICFATKELKLVIEAENLDRVALRAVFFQLIDDGGARWINHCFLPVSVFSHAHTLEFCLREYRTRSIDPYTRILMLSDFFDNGEAVDL